MSVVLLLGASLTGFSAELKIVDAARDRDNAAVRELLNRESRCQREGARRRYGAAFCRLSRRSREARLLIDGGTDVNAANRYGVRPLSLAIDKQQPPHVELLLKS